MACKGAAATLKAWRGLAHQRGDGVLILRARLPDERKLGQGGIQQRGLLRHFQSAGDAAVVAVVHQLHALAFVAHDLLDHLVLGVELAQGEVIGGQLGGQHQLRVLQIGGRGLQGCVGGFHAVPHVAEQVGLIADRERNGVDVLGCMEWPVGAPFRGRLAPAPSCSAGIGGGLREQSPRWLRAPASAPAPADRARRPETGWPQELLLVGIERGIVEHLPPRALGNRILGRSRLPGRLGLPCRRHGSRGSRGCGPLIARSDGASGGEPSSASSAAPVRPGALRLRLTLRLECAIQRCAFAC